jgi:hypothetical protein
MVNFAATSPSRAILYVQRAAMKIHLSIATVFCFKFVASLHQDATSHLRMAIDMPLEAKHTEVPDHRDLTAGALTGLVLYDTSTKTNITLTNNLTIVSADPKYTVIALLSDTAGIESVRFRHVQAGKSTVYTRTENVFWYTLCSNIGTTNLNTCSFLKYGTHTVTATAFAKDDAPPWHPPSIQPCSQQRHLLWSVEPVTLQLSRTLIQSHCPTRPSPCLAILHWKRHSSSWLLPIIRHCPLVSLSTRSA